MSGFEAWIGNCDLRQIEGGGAHQCQAAVWADSADTFRARLAAYIWAQGYKLFWAEECHPVSQYLQRHGNPHKIGALARAVHEGHHVELSRLVAVGETGESELENYLTITEHELEPLSDQTGIPFWDQEWIAPDLKDLLFGQPEDGPPLRTYFIVDATLRKNITGVFDLDSGMVDVPIQCLFKGDAAEELKEAAPYLIDMTLPEGAWDNRDLVPSFHKDFFKKHWGQPTGVFIRTPALMSEVWGHFRKFTRIQMEEDGRWVYFRFEDPRTVSTFVEALDEDDTHKFLGPHQLINPAQTMLKAYNATNPIGENQRRALPPLIMKNDYIKAFGADLKNKFREKLVRFICEEAPDFERLEADKQVSVIDSILKQAITQGIKIERAVANFTLASILFGQHLINDPHFERIIKSSSHQNDVASELLKQVRFRLSPTTKG